MKKNHLTALFLLDQKTAVFVRFLLFPPLGSATRLAVLIKAEPRHHSPKWMRCGRLECLPWHPMHFQSTPKIRPGYHSTPSKFKLEGQELSEVRWWQKAIAKPSLGGPSFDHRSCIKLFPFNFGQLQPLHFVSAEWCQGADWRTLTHAAHDMSPSSLLPFPLHLHPSLVLNLPRNFPQAYSITLQRFQKATCHLAWERYPLAPSRFYFVLCLPKLGS